MRLTSRSLPTLALLMLPVMVAAFSLGTVAAVALVTLVLAWRWVNVLIAIQPSAGPDLELQTICASHFVEKARWCMDRLGVRYREVPDVGVLGVFFAGRTVPRLLAVTGNVTSVIGNSSDILRYLWGRYSTEYGDRASFLRPDAETLELEARLDRYGVDLQRWFYYHVLGDRALTLQAWGLNDPRLPVWQRLLIGASYPLLRFMMRRAFRLGDQAHSRVVNRIEASLQDMESRLADGRTYLRAGPQADFADISLASMTGLWLQPAGYGGGQADPERVDPQHYPARMQDEVSRWRRAYPAVVSFVERLYGEERVMSG